MQLPACFHRLPALTAAIVLLVTQAPAAITVIGLYHLGEPGSCGAASPYLALTNSGTAGTSRNITSYQNNGSTVSLVLPVGGASNSTAALSVTQGSGQSGYFAGTTTFSFTDNFALEIWVNPASSALSGNHDVFCLANNAGTMKIAVNAGTWQALINGTAFATGSPAVAGQWTTAAIIRSNGVSRFYINGVLQSGTGVATPVIGNPMLFFGPAGLNGFSGTLDEARLFTFVPGTDDPVAALSIALPPPPPVPIPVLSYAVAPAPWSIDQRGNQRVVVTVTQAVDAVRANLAWRRRDSRPEGKNIVVVDAATGVVITNRIAISVSRETGTMTFQPQTVPGDYHIYFMPFTDDPNYNGYYGGSYVSLQNTASAAWLAANSLPAGSAALPAATVQRIEARLPIDNFWPMEVPMSASEKASFLAANPGAYLVFPEDRLHPIKMRDELPYRWLAGPTNSFSGTALRNEYFAFQLGLYASTQTVQNVRLTFSNLTPTGGGNVIPSSSLNCINRIGTNWDGRALTNTVNVAQGAVQALWCGVLVPPAAATGLYTGTITINADNAPAKVVNLALTVDTATAVRHGDDEPQKHSRLRWLDSQVAVDDTVIPPYTPVTLSNQTVGVLGRTLTFTNLGFPASIKAGTNEILQSPVQFAVEVGGSPVILSGGTPTVTMTNQGRVNWQSTASSGALTLQTTAEMEFDGHVKYLVTVSASSATTLSNVKLKIPLTAVASSLMAGINYEGGVRPSGFSWSWTSPHDSVWLGGVKAGLHTEFRGGSYHGPLLNLYQPAAPPTWGGGSVLVTNFGGGALLQASTGSKSLAAGASVTYEFALLITPVKPLDTALQFGDRYYHDPLSPTPPSDFQDWNVNVINVHHANFANPFINWPFAVLSNSIGFITNHQAQGAKVKLYYTVREVTQKMAEIWAVRSLGNEVLASGGGGGFPWLREHFISDYSVAWYVPTANSDYDAAVTTTRDSRFYNYYVEGVRWLAQNAHIDGLYLDDVAFDRLTLKRVRRALKQEVPGSRIDLHSNTGFSLGPINQYAEFLPYVDRIWFGESFNYNAMTPEEWLARVSGIPFGLMGEMLQGGGNPWLGAVFGMTTRWGWTTAGVSLDPRPVWRIWDRFGGLTNASMIGWWDDNAVVSANNANVKVTAFVKNGQTLLAVGNFSSTDASVTLTVNWTALGLNPTNCTFYAPASSGFQSQTVFQPGDSIPVTAKQGWLFLVQEGNTNGAGATAPRLQGHFWLSETNGTTVRDALGTNHGTYRGGPVLGSTNIPPGAEITLRSVTMSGGQWAEIPAALADRAFRSGGSWTISFWVRPTLPSPAYNAIFSWMDNPGTTRGILFYLESNGSFDFWLGDNNTWNNWPNYNPGTGLQDRWYHVAATYDGINLRAYLDGQSVKTVAIGSFIFPASGRPITVGLRPGASPSLDLHGRMTDLRIYDGPLSAQQILQLHSYPGRHVAADASNDVFLTLAVAAASPYRLVLTLPAIASWQYQLQTSTNLTDWAAIGPTIASPPAGNWISITNSTVMSAYNFFRMRVTP